jgi:hypothetical protein
MQALTEVVRVTETMPEEWDTSIICPTHKKAINFVCSLTIEEYHY